MAASKKPKAADRTVDMFSGKTHMDEVAEAERIATGADLKGEADAERTGASMEQKVEAWRDKAFEVQEWSSRLFPHDPDSREKTQFRVTRKNGYCYIERVYSGGDGKSISAYAGLMVHEEDFEGLVKVVVEAYRKSKDK